MSEAGSGQQRRAGRKSREVDLTILEGEPTSRADIQFDSNFEKLLEKVSVEERRGIWDAIVFAVGALASLVGTALTFTQIPDKNSSVNFATVAIIIGSVIVVLGVGLVGFSLYRRFRARRLQRMEDRLSGPDLRAINLFVTRELELLSTLGEGDKK